jgi:hypothetical protein
MEEVSRYAVPGVTDDSVHVNVSAMMVDPTFLSSFRVCYFNHDPRGCHAKDKSCQSRETKREKW